MRIVDGWETNYESFRGVVAVKSSLGLCSGTLIDPEIVLTAWHCLTSNFASYEIIGGADINTAPIHYGGVRTGAGRWDIAVLHLERPVTEIPFYDLRNPNMTVPARGDFTYLVGYGYTQLRPDLGLGIHRYGTSTLYSYADDRITIMGNPSSACNGDSGGPLFAEQPETGKWVVTGVTSMADSECRPGEITIYQNVLTNHDYIEGLVQLYTGHGLAGDGHPGDLPARR
eukprot:TRINITY_DN1119_c0_g1_i3.p1 TRINITY_DN1119_c0_g1~~TRINITY_DN1119_c0_g1_i3.p1  ORF type:complete len:256 (-),score=50.50 TRINITY_DN1119_c0_g1_i3:79-762(-)